MVIEDSRAEQHAHRLASPRMSGCGDAAAVEAPAETWNRSFNEIKLIKDVLHVPDSETPDQWCTGIVRWKVQHPRVEMSRLNNHEAVSSPVIDQRTVAVQRPAKTVRENNNRQFTPSRRHRYLHLQVLTTAPG
ncbi:hypothetical protein D3C74_429140 [compost metagenome]